MFEGLRRKFAHFILRRKYIRKETETISFNGILSGANNFFIVMPSNEKDFSNSLDIIKYYLIHRKDITLFIPEHKYSSIPEKDKFRFITYQPALKKPFSLPYKNLVRRIESEEFEVVLDLNREEDIFCSAVSNIVKSKIRVGFVKEFSDKYYSMQIAGNQNEPERVYRGFLNYLQMF